VELALKVRQPFTVVGLGDLLQFQPFANSSDPDVKYLLDIVRSADVTTGDLENEIMDFDNFGHAGGNLATKEVADDWARMGIDLVSRANNKDQRAPGVWEDLHQVERVGIIHAGVAHSLPEARMARYFGTPKGLVGFAGLYSEGGTDACCAGGALVQVTPQQLAGVKAIKDSVLARRNEVEVPVDMPPADAPGEVKVFGVTFTTRAVDPSAPPPPSGRRGGGGGAPPGPDDGVMNTIHLTLFHGVTAPQMALLREIAGQPGSGDLKAFGTQFRVMDRPGEHSFDMNPTDLKEALTQIRTGKQASDIMVTNFHWHQNRYDFQAYSHDHFPADFEIKFAHAAVDQGDDVFIAQGVHTLKGVEIYKGRPIFYGTSNFIFQSAIMPLPKGHYPGQGASEGFRGPFAASLEANAKAAPGEIVGEHEFQGFWQLKANLESIVAYSRFENGRLAEVRIYPVDLGQTPRPGSQVGIPRRPTPEVAKKILDEVIEYSKPFGTKIAVENGVGVIRLAPDGSQRDETTASKPRRPKG
jgi:poly-gamma-glutamate capsule biosynthesis protein CapA/YwtB (metallophosphatase superfamily)